MPRLISLVLCLLLALPAHAEQYVLRRTIPGQDDLSAHVGMVLAANPGATVTREGEGMTDLAERSKIYQGDTIKTDGSGSLVIGFIDGTNLAIDPNSTITIDFHNSGSRGLWSILEGIYAFVSGAIAKSGEDAMVINTPVGTIGVRGTAVIIDLFHTLPSGMQVILLPDPDGHVGRVSVTNETGSREIDTAYDSIIVTSVGAMPGTQPISPDDIRARYGEVKYLLENAIGSDTNLSPDPTLEDTEGRSILPPSLDQDPDIEVVRGFGPLKLVPNSIVPVLMTYSSGGSHGYCVTDSAAQPPASDNCWSMYPGHARSGQYFWFKATTITSPGATRQIEALLGIQTVSWQLGTRDYVPNTLSFTSSEGVAGTSIMSNTQTLEGFTGALTISIDDPFAFDGYSEIFAETVLRVLRAGNDNNTWEETPAQASTTVQPGDRIQLRAMPLDGPVAAARQIMVKLMAGDIPATSATWTVQLAP